MDKLLIELIESIKGLTEAIKGNKISSIQPVLPAAVKPNKPSKVNVDPVDLGEAVDVSNFIDDEVNTDEVNTDEVAPKNTSEGKKKPEVKIYTFDEIRQKCADFTRNGRREDIKKLLNKYGVENLTALPEDKYQKFMGEVLKIES